MEQIFDQPIVTETDPNSTFLGKDKILERMLELLCMSSGMDEH